MKRWVKQCPGVQLTVVSPEASSIMSKLSELGYEEDIEKMSDEFKMEFEDHPLVKQPKELTQRSACNHRTHVPLNQN